jgi:hypothetical protein
MRMFTGLSGRADPNSRTARRGSRDETASVTHSESNSSSAL